MNKKNVFIIVVLKTNLNRHFYLFYKKENEKKNTCIAIIGVRGFKNC